MSGTRGGTLSGTQRAERTKARRQDASGLALLVALVFAATLLVPAPAQADHDVTPARIEGADRFDTAARIAEETFDPDRNTVAVIARGDDFPDALAGSGLAGVYGAPILLVEEDEVPERTHEALEALTIADILILGGEAAVGAGVEAELEADYTVQRIEGEDRYETAAAIAQHIDEHVTIGHISGETSAFVVSGESFPDALTAGPLAYSGNVPVLLTLPDELPETTGTALDDLGIERVLVLGGTAAVSASVADDLDALGLTVERVAGARRTDTAALFASMLVDTWGYDVSRPMLATGADFPDALAAGPRGGALGRPILLTRDAQTTSAETVDWLIDRCPDVEAVQALGGTAAVSSVVLDDAVTAAEACHAVEPEVVASFSTPLVPGEPRNHNIHLAADYIDGSVITPGSSFSLNQAIGPRTSERGFVENGFIDDDGEVISVVGGGVSQMATTFVNAAWFAGIQIDRFRQHTIYFERYPMCREATLIWGTLDVVVTNDSPHDITVTTDYSSEHVAVSFVSIPWAEVDDSWIGQPYNIEGPGGAFSVDCGRTIHYPDGTSHEESYSWRYDEGYPG